MSHSDELDNLDEEELLETSGDPSDMQGCLHNSILLILAVSSFPIVTLYLFS